MTEQLPVTQAAAYIDKAVTAGDADALEALRTQAAGYQDYYTRREIARDRANDYGEIKVRAERGLGQIDLAANPHGVRDDTKARDVVTATLPWKPGVSSHTRADWRKLAMLDDERFDWLIARARDDQEVGVSTTRVLNPKTSGPESSRKITQGLTSEWHTPGRYIDAARAVLGEIDLDPASSEDANTTVKAAQFYSADDDGLTQQWHGRVWLNPPYGSLGPAFVTRLIDEYRQSTVTAGLALVNCNCVPTRWFRPLWNYLLCFHYGRINFAAGTEERTGSTHGSVFAYLGPDPDLFDDVFSEFGIVVQRRRRP